MLKFQIGSVSINYSILLISLFILSCSNNANQYLLDDIEVHESEMTISLLTIEIDELYDQFPNHQFGALRPAERAIFDNHLPGLFARKTQSQVYGKLNSNLLLQHSFTKRNFGLRNNEIQIIAPEPGTKIQANDEGSRFIVILDQYYFTPYNVQVGGDTYAGHEGDIENRIKFETKYVIWDNVAQDAIAWGALESNERLNMSNQSLTYRQLVSNIFEQIIRASPFRLAYNV